MGAKVFDTLLWDGTRRTVRAVTEADYDALLAVLLQCVEAIDEALNALLDYVETLEKQGGMMNYGRKVIGLLTDALAAAHPYIESKEEES